MSKTLSAFTGTDDGRRGLKQAEKGHALESAIITYYSELSEAEAQEQSGWGRFSLGELLAQEQA